MSEFKTYEFESKWGTPYTLRFKKGQYQNNGRLYVDAQCWDEDLESWTPFAPVTVNLWEPIDGESYAYLDLNNSEAIVSLLCEQGCVSIAGRVAQSGFCVYPEGLFTEEFLEGCVG